MKNSKTTTLLAAFSANDLFHFRKYLLSPYFNENKDLLRLFDLLVQEVIPATGSIREKEELWQALFHKTPYLDQTLRRLMSELTNHALTFTACHSFLANPLEEGSAKLQFLLDPGLAKHFEGVLRQVNLALEKQPAHSPAAYYQMFLIERARHLQLETAGKPDTLKFLGRADFYLDSFYFSQKLKNLSEGLGYQKTRALDVEIGAIPGLLEYLPSSPYGETPLIKAYLLVVAMLQQPDDEAAFHSLKSLLEESANRFDKNELYNLFIHLLNYCIDTKINRGRTEYFEELFALYQLALETKILLPDGVLDPFHYKNIITVGLRVNALEWTERFIREYTPQLSDSSQANAFTYNLAKVYFQQERYEKVIEQLREVEYQDIVYALGAKLMLLKTYFELKEFLPLDSLSDSFRIFLQRNKLLSREEKQKYLNVLRFVKKLSHINPGDRKQLEKTRLQVENCQALADKPWILDKLRELTY